MASKRILALEEATELTKDEHYLLVDHGTDGTQKMSAETLLGDIGDLSDLETEDQSSLVAAINEAAQSGSGGGQPIAVTLASAMTDTDAIYLYLGSESGYDYGYIYAYLSGVWTKTTLYGRGQDGTDGEDGEDGYSPSASVTQTSTGVTISITDESGTTTATVTNGTATDAQVQTYVEQWLEDNPDATTTVTDGSITEAKLADDVATALSEANGYKIADKSNWLLTLTAGTTLTDTRITSLAESTVSGYTTYLIPNANIPADVGFAKAIGTTYWIGHYVESSGSRTYTTNYGTLYANSDYTGIAICMVDSSGTLADLQFMYRMEVITRKNTPVDLIGFSGYETDEYLTCEGVTDSRLQFVLKVDSDKVYAIKFSDFDFYQMWAVRTTRSTFNAVSSASYALMGDFVIIPSIDGYLKFSIENNTVIPPMYASDGLEIYVLDKPWEVEKARSGVPCRALIHAGNFKHKVLLSYALGWSGVEMDVRKTSDGEFVLSHDAAIGGLTIANSTFDALKAVRPDVMKIDELIEISAYFNCMIDYHFETIGADDRWDLIVRGLQAGIEYLGYYTGITGYIGTEDANTFYQYGIVYGYGDGRDVPSSIDAAKYYIGSTGGNTTDNPQIAFVLPATSDQGTLTNNELRTTYKGYFSDIQYFTKYYPLYDALCKELSLDVSTLTFTASGTKKIYPSVEPVYCSEDITWESSDTSIATVTGSSSIYTLYPYATVTAVANGTCTITATVGDYSATCTVTITGIS